MSLGTAVKLNSSGQIVPCGDNDPDVIGIITAIESSWGSRYYLVSSSDVALSPLPNTVSIGDKLTTAAGGGLRTASAGEIIVAIALENGDGNSLTLEKIMIALGFASDEYFIENQRTSAQAADFWIDDTGRVGYLVVDSSAVINESGGNYDFRVEGNTDLNLLFADASADMVGIGTNSPLQKLDLNGAFRLRQRINISPAPDTTGVIWVKQSGSAPDTIMFWDDQNHIWLAVCPPRANPKCQVYGGSNTDCNPGPVPVPFTNETRVDNGYTHSTTTNPSRVYVNQDGYYKITYQIAFNNNVNNRVDMHTYIRLNGTTNIGGDGYCYMRDNTNAPREVANGVVYLVNLSNGDYVEVVAERYSGANGNTYAIEPQCWLTVERENVSEGAGGSGGGGPQWADAGTFLYPVSVGRNIRPNSSGTVGEASGRWDNVYSVDGDFSNDLKISGGIDDGAGFGSAGYVLKTDGVGDVYWASDSAGGRLNALRADANPWLYDSVTIVSGANISLAQTGDSITISSSTNWDTLKAYRDTLNRDFQRIRAESNPWLVDSLTIVAGSNISLTQNGDTLTISSSGTPGGNFQRLRADANPWLYDSVTFISGTNITMTQSGNQITITSTGASQWTDGGTYLQPINANRNIVPNNSGTVGESSTRWNGVYSTNGDFSGNISVGGNITISGGLNDGVGFGTSGYCLKTDGAGDVYWAADTVGGSFVRFRSDANSWLPDSVTLVSGTNITLSQAGDSITISASGNVSGTGTATEVAFWVAADSIGSSSNLYWDNSNGRLGIGTSTPNQNLSIAGSVGIIEGGLFPNYYSIFYGSDQTADIAYYLPQSQGGTNTFLMNDGAGNLSWSNPIPQVVTILGANRERWRNQPAALRELFNNTGNRTMVDLTNATQVRLTVGVVVAGAATAQIRAQYSTDLSTWSYLDGGTGPSVAINTAGLKVSSWVNIVSAAQTDVYIRIVGINGNGIADPQFGLITLQFK
ncbi:hypothetical protein J7M00_06260 [bacterium]|nr:hypothetical protein [bacterium]